MAEFAFTSESVCAGHPDKVADQISDAIVDEALRQDKNARVAVETLVTKNKVVLAGEVALRGTIDYPTIARNQIKRLGYTKALYEFTDRSPILVLIHEQSPEIAQGVNNDGAGDQGMMFGYACQDTAQFMPMPIALAHALVKALDQAREQNVLPYLRPDGKSQVTVSYKNGKPVAVKNICIAVPHSETISLEEVKLEVFEQVILPVLQEHNFSIKIESVVVNGTGAWHIGGPARDTGLTGRKIVVDGYGGYARVGGGAFSGKDPTKVDRSGAYAARFIAKNIVAQGLAKKAEVMLAYAIGSKKPTWQYIDTFGTAKYSLKAINNFANAVLDTSVAGILDQLSLRSPIYLPTASYGHFGRQNLPWEQIKN